jgi:hypothetical protein
LDFNLSRRAAPSKHSLWQLAQFQLNTECMRADHNLLLVVGHANLLHFLADLGDEQTQRFEKELAASNEYVTSDKLLSS